MNGERAETYLRLLAEAELRRAPADDGVARVQHAAAVLTAIGAVDAEVAESVGRDLEVALAIRSLIDRGRLVAHPGRMTGMRMHAALAAAQGQPGPGPPTAPGGSVLAVPSGQALLLKEHDASAEVWLLALVMSPGKAVISVASRRRSWKPTSGPRMTIFGQLSVVDDSGTSYAAHFTGAMGPGWEDGWLDLHPVPAASVRWIEVQATTGGPRVRLDCAPGAAQLVSSETLTPASPGERLLDSAAEKTLANVAELHGRSGDLPSVLLDKVAGGWTEHLAGGLDRTVEVLEAADALPPGSPVPRRLAALRQVLGDTAEALPWSAMASLPEQWASVLAYRYRLNWPRIPEGFAPVTAVFPELDGVQFILAGMRSDADRTVLRAQALGLDPAWYHSPFGGFDLRFSCWIRDSAGHWHIASIGGWNSGNNISWAGLELQVVPPLHRATTWLEVVITGRSGRVRATVPLDWTATHE
jgi:hypothetical protein